jgi:RNA polymerase-binding transcription factor DksA
MKISHDILENMTVYKEKLETMLLALTEELKDVGIHNPENPSDWIAVPEDLDANEPDLNLAADVVEEWDGRQALVATLEQRYNEITRALTKIETGTFGTCEICSAPIEKARLEVNPSARTCKEHMNDEKTLSS